MEKELGGFEGPTTLAGTMNSSLGMSSYSSHKPRTENKCKSPP